MMKSNLACARGANCGLHQIALLINQPEDILIWVLHESALVKTDYTGGARSAFRGQKSQVTQPSDTGYGEGRVFHAG